MKALLLATLLLAGCDDDYVLDPGASDSQVDLVLALGGDSTRGETVFVEQHCATCHDPAGEADLAGPALGPIVPARDDRELVEVILGGMGTMPPFTGSDQQAADVLAWLRAAFGE